MDTSHLKAYAPKARREFIAAVTDRAAAYGLTAKHTEPVIEEGDVALIGDKAHPRSVAAKRKRLEERIQQHGFAQVMEAMAYTWFNRFMAIRFMELHGYLEHGRRVLSHPVKSNAFEILEACAEVELPGVDRERVIELKLDGRKDEELYRLLLLGQCHALHQAMPFLFEAVDDETELLLPGNLTKTDSLIRHLVDEIPEDDWQQVEIIGWLYQFYISEKKDRVIGKVVNSEDIPAATQLFTPNWIVKYMVQNSLGALWLATYPRSSLKGQLEYYIEPAEQTDEVKTQLATITPSQISPEEVTLIDPASGSGHILVEAYELFKAIYLERGYRLRDIPQLVLEKNLFGLDIDERAAQLTGFALMMKGRSDDRRLFERSVKLSVMALVNSAGFDADTLAKGVELAGYGLQPRDVTELKRLFEYATTFGSLIQVPDALAEKLPALERMSEATSQDIFVSDALKRLAPLVKQAQLLAAKYDAVVANPPYMGSKGMNPQVKTFTAANFPKSKSDLFAASAERYLGLARSGGFVGLMTPFVWMFLKTYEPLRAELLETKTLLSLIQPEYHAFFESAYVPICTFVLRNRHLEQYEGSFIQLSDFYGADLQPQKALEAIRHPDVDWFYTARPDDFKHIPGAPVAYWVSDRLRQVFANSRKLGGVSPTRDGITTGNNDLFLRRWFEVSQSTVYVVASDRSSALSSGRKWFPCNKGGSFRRWYGNNEYLIRWEDDGAAIRSYTNDHGRRLSTPRNMDYYFKESVTWTDISSSLLGVRWSPGGAISDASGPATYPAEMTRTVLAFLCSSVAATMVKILNPTMHCKPGNVANLPWITNIPEDRVLAGVDRVVALSKSDWDAYERSWDFQSFPLLTSTSDPTPTLESSYTAWVTQNRDTIAETKHIEEDNNRLFIDAYGLADEFTPDVPIEQITLTVNPAYRYGGNLTEEEQWTRFRQDSMKELVSYAVGCMMGRYSLDAPGLIYAHSGNEDFDPSRYVAFPADDDGIIPVTEIEWFDDDAADRLIDFMSVAWDKSHLEENLSFLANSLSPKKNESSRETIRRYLCDKFFKDHLQTYKNRPIYWLFSSGKQQAFQCLVYLHRYNEGTLSRMRTKYVIPLQGLIAGRVDRLAEDFSAASSTRHRKRLERERDTLIKQRTELLQFDEKLRHYADQRIKLDLDDGVKVNYPKFGDLLAEVKTVTGTTTD